MRVSRVFVLLTVAVVLGGTVLTAGVDPKKLNRANKMVQKGERALASANLPAAKQAFQDAIQVVPSFPNAYIGLGQIALHEKDYDLALSHFQAARKGYGEHGKTLLGLQAKRFANARREIVELQDGIAELERMGSSSNAPPGGYGFQISGMQNKIRMLEAIESPKEQESEDMAPGEIYFHIGNALFRLNRVEEAVSAWETCCEKSPKFPMVYNNLALAYLRAGRVADAKTSLAKAEELGFPVNPQFKADLAKSN